MNKQTLDQGWHQLQAHVDGFLGQFLRTYVPGIEYKPLFITKCMGMPS